MLKLRTVKIAYWVFCASKHNRKFQILTFGEILTIRFSNLNRIRIRILFGFGKSCEYEYEYIRFWKIIRIRIRILFGLKISAEYEYEYHYSVSTIRILFEYRIIRSPLVTRCNIKRNRILMERNIWLWSEPNCPFVVIFCLTTF